MATRSRPAQGVNRLPGKNPKPAYAPDPGPSVVSRGTVSHPIKLTKWHPTLQPADYTPKIVQD